MPENKWEEVLLYKNTLREIGWTLNLELNKVADTIENEDDLFNSLSITIGLLEIAKQEIFLAKWKFEGRMAIND